MEEVETARGFGSKIGWLAVRSSSPADVIAQLGIRAARRAPWSQGIDAAYERHKARAVYVTPPIDGWVLVVATAMFSFFGKTREESRRLPDAVAALSARFGAEVQYFATHRVSDAHEWIKTDGGKVIRAYCLHDGEDEWGIGALTAEEVALAINFDVLDEGPPATRENSEAYREWASHCVDEQMVSKVAARWSVDPSLEGRMLPQGWLGKLPPSTSSIASVVRRFFLGE